MSYISIWAVPCLIMMFVGAGLLCRVDVYDCFGEGARDGLRALVKIIAPLVGLMVAIAMFRASGALELAARLLSPLTSFIKLPSDVVPLALLRPISGSASTAIVTDIFANFGPDSIQGKIASVMMGSTETTFYTIAVYFGAAGIKKTRHTLASALLADLTGIICATLFTYWLIA